MKAKTSITLSESALRAVDRLAGRGGNRSAVIERAILEYVERRARQERDAKDRELLDRHADALNRETADVLEFQAEP
ncbi:MAG TPA: ribbon-helix-helix protein, CopG family [Polyangiaceae bacterium]